MKFLITGGAGFIGSTIASALIDAGHTPVILDSLITGRVEFTRGRIFYKADIGDAAALDQIFHDHPDIKSTIHCAALIIVPESTAKPYEYYRENVAKSIELFHSLNRLGCKDILFSSSASVYESVPSFVVDEQSSLKPTSPYARTKYMMEMVLRDFCSAYGMRGIALRYFNPIGADPKMRTGIHLERPSLVIGKLVDTALGDLPVFEITGTTWPTRDGTGLRDYIHVWDVAQAHVLAVTDFDGAFQRAGNPADGYLAINLGTGHGVTVREMVTAFEHVWGKEINKKDSPPRPGDVAGVCASAEAARRILGWEAKLSIEQSIADALEWGKVRKSVLGYKRSEEHTSELQSPL
jgi:UDP-glucose 4-epimerase